MPMPDTTVRARTDAPTAPDPEAPASWWQLRRPSTGYPALAGNVTADVVVVGAGVTGCSTAWHAAQSGHDVVLLDAREVASGASGRNGGFLLAGLAHRFGTLVDLLGAARARELYELTARGRDDLFATAASFGAAQCARQIGSLRLAVDESELAELKREAELLLEAGINVEQLEPAQLPDGLGAHFCGGLRFPDDGASMPAGWVRALADEAHAAGARIFEHSPAISVQQRDEHVSVTTNAGYTVDATHVVMANEAWLPGLIPQLRDLVMPYRSQMLATAPPRAVDGTMRRVLSHVTWSRRGWDYAQQGVDGHVFVGGEHLEDISRVRTWEETIDADDQAWLESWARRVLEVDPDVETRWAGVLSQSFDGFPIIGPLPDHNRIIICGGWGGAGNVLGFVGGRLVAELIAHGDAAIPAEFRSSRL